MRECDSIEQVKTVYWEAKQQVSSGHKKSKRKNILPDEKIFVMPSQIAEGANKNMVVYQLCTYLEKYLKKNMQFTAKSDEA